MAAAARNAPCPCGSGRKYKRCCAELLEHPERIAKQHDAVGTRIQKWAFEQHREAMHDGLAEIVAGHKDVVLGDLDVALIAGWVLNDRQLPGGGTPAERYAAREDLSDQERDIARRIAAARLGLLRVLRVMPGRWIELQDLAHGSTLVRVISHDVSRSAQPNSLLVGRLMDGPPAPSLWGPVGFLTRESGSELRELLTPDLDALDLHDKPDGLATALHAASREITIMLAPAFRPASAIPKAA
jgi:SEC-C motif-containing protein